MTDFNQGLSENEMKRSRKINGTNTIKVSLSNGVIVQFLKSFFSTSQLLLLIAVIIASYLTNYLDYPKNYSYSISLIVIYLLRGILLLFYLSRPVIDYAALMNAEVSVIRNGKVETIPASGIVLGDVVEINGKQQIMADGRILSCNEFLVDETLYNHRNKIISKKEGDNVYLGAQVIGGQATIEVTSIGKNTVLGNCIDIHPRELEISKKMTSFVRSLNMIAFIAGIGILISFMMPKMTFDIKALIEPLQYVILLYAAIGLCPVLLNSNRMIHKVQNYFQQKNITFIHDQDVAYLADLKVLVLDKQETFTQKKKAVIQSFADDQDLIALGLGLYAMEHDDEYRDAFLNFAKNKKFDIQSLKENMTLLQSSANPSFSHMVSHSYASNTGFIVYSIGSVEDLFDYSKFVYMDGKEVFFGAKEREVIGKHVQMMKRQGLEVLGVAYKVRKSDVEDINQLKDLCFIGVVGLACPLKEGVVEQVKAFEKLGIRVLMMSDENPALVASSALKAGLIDSEEQMISAKMLEGMTERRLMNDLEQYRVLVGLNGSQKGRIISALAMNYGNVGVSVHSIEDIRSISAAKLLISSKENTNPFVSKIANVHLNDHNMDTIINAIQETKKYLIRYETMLQYELSFMIGFMLIAFGYTCINLYTNQFFDLLTVFHLIIAGCILFVLGNMISRYDSKKEIDDTTKGMYKASMGNGFNILLVTLLSYMSCIYFKHSFNYILVSVLMMMVVGTLLFDNRKLNTYSFHFGFVFLKLVILASSLGYMVYAKMIAYNDPMYCIYLVIPLAIVLFGITVKNIVFRKG